MNINGLPTMTKEKNLEIYVNDIGSKYEVIVCTFDMYNVRFDYAESFVSFIKTHLAQQKKK